MEYCKNYCEEKGISTSKLNEAQRTLYYIAENMKMAKSINEEGYKHFQMAIKALEKHTEERTKTRACVCIDKQSAIDAIGNVPDHDDGMVWEALSHAQRNVALLPPVTSQSERKTEKWLSTIHHCKRWMVCSQCGAEHIYDRFTEWNYCPNCGAKMEEKVNADE